MNQKHKHIEINIGKACNNKCRFCMSARVWHDELQLTKFEIVESEIILYAKKWYKSIGFLWGDISIHPSIYKILETCKQYNFQVVNVITNAMLFSQYEKAKKFIKSGTTRVNISIHSHEDSVEDHLTQVKWWLQRKLAAIDNFNVLHEKGTLESPLSINIVLNKMNLERIVETCLYFYKIKKIRDIRINFLWNRFFYEKGDEETLSLTYTDFLPYLKKLIYISIKYNIRITFDTIPACIFYQVSQWNGEYIVKKFLWEDQDHIEEISNLNKDQKFDWKDQKKNDLKTREKSCEKCSYYNSCQWIWNEYVEKYGFSEFKAIV